MRNLTVRRRKAFAGCAGKVKIYIEDINGDTDINGTKCRFLGKLKNNESATYEIGNEKCKIFAIYDSMSKVYCNDFHTIPEGEKDIEVTGVAHFNPFMGNPFYFDGADEEALANRKKNGGKGKMIMIPIMIVAVVAGFLIGFFLL